MKKLLQARNMMVRIGVVSIFSILIWRFILYLNGLFSGNEYNRTTHFFIALAVTILCFILIDTARRIDKISWKQIGMSSLRTNIISFFIGTVVWAIPAALGLVIVLLAGWAEITVTTDLNQLLLSVLILYIIVFLMEAFPEELILRGYVYSYLNTMFPHWITLFIQSLIFSLFAYFIGAIYSVEQLQFIPSFAIILGVFRAISGSVWTSIGFHVAIMTAFQILGPIHGHFDVSGIMTLKLFAFILLPCVVGATVLSFIYSNHNWRKTEPLVS